MLQTTPKQQIKEDYGDIIVRLLGGQDLLRLHLLVATQRAANVKSLELSRADIAWDAKGITVNAGLRITNKRIYAIWDVSRGMQFFMRRL